MGPRSNKVSIYVGNRDTGKTDLLKEIAFSMLNFFPKVLIVDTFDSDVWRNMSTHAHPERSSISVPTIPVDKFKGWRKGIGRLISADTKMTLSLIQQHARNTFIIFEDSRKYVKSQLTDDVAFFIIDSKQKNLDLNFIFHSCKRVPPELLDISDVLVLKKTSESKPPPKMDSWPEIAQMMESLRKDTNRYAYRTLLLN